MSVQTIPKPPPMPELESTYFERGERKYSDWDLKELVLYTQDWIRVANREQVDISKKIAKIKWVILDAVEQRSSTQNMSEVMLVQQVIVRGMYCSQIIRKITKHRIEEMAESGRTCTELRHLTPIIDRCEKWALDRLPPKIYLKSPKNMAKICSSIMDKVENMKDKVLSKA